MPILERDMDYDTMIRRSKSHHCAQCDAPLGVAWGQSLGYGAQYILRCGRKIAHDVINESRLSSMDKAKLNVLRGETGMDSTALMAMDEKTMLQRVNKAQWPQDMKADDKAMLATVAVSYGLDPLLGELQVYRGAPFITINARYRKAQETGQFNGMDSRPATQEERDARGCVDGDVLYRCEVHKKGMDFPIVGWGRVRKAEQGGSAALPINNDPHRMAEKRAEAMALRKAFSMPIPERLWADPAADDTVDAEYSVAPADLELPPAPPADHKTGEIVGETETSSPEPKVEAGPDGNDPTGNSGPPAASAALQIPDPKKKVEPLTAEDFEGLSTRLTTCDVTGKELGAYCNGKPRLWGIKGIEDLTRAQFEEVDAALGTGVLKGATSK